MLLSFLISYSNYTKENFKYFYDFYCFVTGYICQRGDLLTNNCCGTVEKRYICDTCNADGCCVLYEHCVSCCLDPDKVSV